MIISAVPRRYAQALLMIATERKKIEEYRQDLAKFRQLLLDNPEIEQLLANMRVTAEKKKEALRLLLPDSFDPVVRNFLHLLIDKRRENFFLDVITAYEQYADEILNIINADVWSVVQLTTKDERQLAQRLSHYMGKKVRVRNIIDPALLGGLRIKVGDLVIDGSVTRKLALLKKQLQVHS